MDDALLGSAPAIFQRSVCDGEGAPVICALKEVDPGVAGEENLASIPKGWRRRRRRGLWSTVAQSEGLNAVSAEEHESVSDGNNSISLFAAAAALCTPTRLTIRVARIRTSGGKAVGNLSTLQSHSKVTAMIKHDVHSVRRSFVNCLRRSPKVDSDCRWKRMGRRAA